jgi:hypothetical protein
MKKRNPFLTPYSLLLALIPFASAGLVDGLETLGDGIGQAIVVIFEFITDLILDINQIDEYLFAKIIFLVLIYLVVYTTTKKSQFFGTDENIVRIIAAAISILAVRFIPDNLIEVVFLQYSALGVGIGTAIPFIIMLFFLHQSNIGPLPRKIGWIFYGISYVAIFSYSYTNLEGIADYIYWAGIIGIIIAFFFDKQIHAAFGDVNLKSANREFEVRRLTRFRNELRDAIADRDSAGITPVERNVLDKRIAYIRKEMSKIQKSL